MWAAERRPYVLHTIAQQPLAGSSTNIIHDNVFIGHSAGRLNEVGSSNTFVGTFAGDENIDGTSNTFIGAVPGSII